MNILENFKNYLIQATPSSQATVKNYMADVRKFIRWYETKYRTPFIASAISARLIEQYKQEIIQAEGSNKSLKRYLSSLNKFFEYLKSANLLSINPFDTQTYLQASSIDSWNIKAFKQYLYRSNLSTV